uniref:Putative secreted protein n=1 Tax=Amblyomma tuberculatum TaxID=48802 RepID=A0A6M2E3H3_9ACAR
MSQMRYVLLLRGTLCWAVSSDIHNISMEYPGMQVTATQICKQAFPSEQYVRAEMVISGSNQCKLKCKYEEYTDFGTEEHSTYREAPDYTPCGEKKVCVRGFCVDAPKGMPTRPVEKVTTAKPDSAGTRRSTTFRWITRRRRNAI